ncbi:hypothetical protein OGAPHI_005051 [Ogataea philodendri]|uniref:Uncharacterized protein n=2 Tax=Ogataea TaxID=461281 RepID=A0A9P8T353_9ASCO|nr:uncharacterized protein OGAPHI_005051 [Ogataea philodendri]KAH3663650.1 hypothetical protein OGAPHI_005051 [Ogataea philodendri]
MPVFSIATSPHRNRKFTLKAQESDIDSVPSRPSTPVEKDEYVEWAKPREERNFNEYYQGLDEFETLPVLVSEGKTDDDYEEYRLKRKQQDRDILSRLKRPSYRKLPDQTDEDEPVQRNMVQFGYGLSKSEPRETYTRSTDLGDDFITGNLLLDSTVRSLYDMDEQDSLYLEHVNSRLSKENKHMSMELFEVIMTFFEIEWYFIEKLLPPKVKNQYLDDEQTQLQVQLYGSDDGIGVAPEEDQCCAVCNRNDCNNSNAIVFCDGCDIAVHQECYGVAFIPEGPWFCRKCLTSRNQKVKCLFCPSVTGAFKQSDNGEWGHVSCTLWINELYFASNIYMEPIQGIPNIPKSRWKLVCYICRQRVGACTQCSKPTCSTAYHVTCARRAELYMELSQGVQGAVNDQTSVISYCDRHSPKDWDLYHDTKLGIQKTRLYFSTGKNRSVGNKIAISKSEKRELKDTRNHWFKWKTARGAPILPIITIRKLEKLLQSQRVSIDSTYLYELAKFWTLKRESKGGPLVKRPDSANYGSFTDEEINERLQILDFINNDIKRLTELSNLSLEKAKLDAKDTNELINEVDLFYLPMQNLVTELLQQFLKHGKATSILSVAFDDPTVLSVQQIVDKVENHEYKLVSELIDDINVLDEYVIANMDHNSSIYKHIRNYWRRLRSQCFSKAEQTERILLKGDLRRLLGGLVSWVTVHGCPVVEDHLWESLTTGSLSQITSETEGLIDRQVSLHSEQWSTWSLFLRDNLTSLSVQNRVDTTNSVLWTLNLNQEDRLLDSWLSQKHSSKGSSSHGWHDLTSTSVDSIGVQSNIHDVESDTSQGLTNNWTLLGSPLETGVNVILDFKQVLNSLGLVNDNVRSVTVWTETPDLSGVGDIPTVLVSHQSGSLLEVVSGVNLSALNSTADLVVQWLGLQVDSVVLVWRLGQSDDSGLSLNGLSVRNNWRRDSQWNTGVVVLQVTQTNLQVQLTSGSNNVLTRLRNRSHNTWVGLGQSLKTLNQLWKIVTVLNLNGNLHNWGDRELHDLHVVRSLVGGQSTRFEQELVNTNQTNNVTSWTVVNSLNESSHHKNGSLDSLDEQIVLLTWNVVRTLDSNLHTRLDGTGENSTESVESTLIRGWNHLRHVKHQVSVRVTVLDGQTRGVVRWTLVQGLSSVELSSNWRWQVDNNHLKQSVSSWQEFSHDNLQESLTLEVLLITLQRNLKLLQQSWDLVLLEVHDSREKSENRVEHEHVESSLQWFSRGIFVLVRPLLGLWVEVRVTPQSLHHLGSVNTEFLGVSDGELSDSEGPTVQTGTESNGTLLWVNLDVTKDWLDVGRDDDVNGLDSSGERLVKLLLGDLQLQHSSVNLVDNNNWLNSLTKRLSQHSLGLDTHTLNTVNNDQSTVGNSQGGSNFRREVNVTWRIDQVDQELVALGLLLDLLDILVLHLREKGDGGRLDGNTSLLFIFSGIGESGLTGLSSRNDTGSLHKRVSKSRFSVIDVSDNGHVTNIRNLVH